MGTTNSAFEELTKLYEKLQAKRDKLREQLASADKEFEAVSTTMRLVGQGNRLVNLVNVEGMAHLEALTAIAKANNNTLSTRTARRIMEKAGLFKTAKNASSIIFTAINRSGRFERESSGVYRLIEPKAKDTSSSSSSSADDLDKLFEDLGVSA